MRLSLYIASFSSSFVGILRNKRRMDVCALWSKSAKVFANKSKFLFQRSIYY